MDRVGQLGESAHREVTKGDEEPGVSTAEKAGVTAAVTPARPPNHIVVRWRGDEEFESGRPGGPTLRVDGHGKVAQSPVEYC